ncbi:MAG: 4Fe-4S dicluster domain-containing protein [Magnetococcales bacterium]|nr:4Fe-4S dicluster domain-containing protein [Magnetococcales bacterium]
MKNDPSPIDPMRRKLLSAGMAAATLSAAPLLAVTEPEGKIDDTLQTLLQKHFKRMNHDEIQAALSRIERRAQREYGQKIHCRATPAPEDVRFGFALNLSRCKGSRQCVTACIQENNTHREPNSGNIRVLAMPRGTQDLTRGDPYYPETPPPGPETWFLPIQCQQCENPPCVRACPVEATWQEPDGIVVIDYDWCIGCRYCMAACPYWARRFNWNTPQLSDQTINPHTDYLGNRPRTVGVMEKCTFCLQRTRHGQLPACLEACPTGARIFGNLLDPKGEIRYLLENRTVFRLKEDQATEPKFWYFTDV